MLGPQTTAVLTILDNDAPTVQFAAASQSVSRAAPPRHRDARRRSQRRRGRGLPGGGNGYGGGVDYTLANGTSLSSSGQISVTILVPTVKDTLFEGPETIVLGLANPTGGAVIGSPASTTITITDNDTSGTVQFGAAAYSVAENAPSGSFNLTVNRTGANLASGIIVIYSVTGGTATGGGDYTLAGGALTFAAGQTTAIHPRPDPR